MKKEKNLKITKYNYLFFAIYAIDGEVILTYADGEYYLGGVFPKKGYLLGKKELSQNEADNVLEVVNSLTRNLRKLNEKN